MNQTIRINNMPPNLNVYRNMHFQKLDKAKKEWAGIIRWLCKEQKIAPVVGKRVDMVYEFYFKDRREHDPDNYACCAKFINDGLVDAGILVRDNFDHIRRLAVEQGGISKQPYILLHMTEVNDESA